MLFGTPDGSIHHKSNGKMFTMFQFFFLLILRNWDSILNFKY